MLLTTSVDIPVSKSDIEQVRPGAGKDTKLAIDVEEGTMPGGLSEAPVKKGNSVLRWRPSSSKGKDKDDSKEKGKLPVSPVSSRSERGKFIEDVSSSGFEEPAKSGTLRLMKQPAK
jgi:hypothetical protein